jgi:hypothetical protein
MAEKIKIKKYRETLFFEKLIVLSLKSETLVLELEVFHAVLRIRNLLLRIWPAIS